MKEPKYEYRAYITKGMQYYPLTPIIYRQSMTSGMMNKLQTSLDGETIMWIELTKRHVSDEIARWKLEAPTLYTYCLSEAISYVVEECMKVGAIDIAMLWLRYI